MKRFSFILLLILMAAFGCQNDSKVAAGQPSASSTDTAEPTSPAPAAETPDTSAPSTQPTAPPISNQPASEPSTQPTAPVTPGGSAPKGNVVAKGSGTIPLKGEHLPDRIPQELKDKLNDIKNGQEQGFKIPPTNSGPEVPESTTKDWFKYEGEPASQAAPEIAALVEKTLAAMKNTSGHVEVVYESPEGNGSFNQDLKVKDSSDFLVPFVTVGLYPLTCEEVANGKDRLVQFGPEWRDHSTVSAPTKPYTPTAAPGVYWPRDFTQMVFEPITHSKVSWPDIVHQWLKGDQGYQLEVDCRDIPFQAENPSSKVLQTYHYKDFRFRASRSDAAAAKYGKSDIEVVIDHYKWLPMTIRSIYTDKSGKNTWKITWTCSYRFNQAFTAADFKAPYSRKLKT